MLIALKRGTNQSIAAASADRDEGPFLCPECREELSLRKGTVSIPHFSHKPKSRCAYGTGEQDIHRECKWEIFERLRRHPQASDVSLERHFGDVRPDIFAYIKGVPVAIELQLSNLPPEVISRRTQSYTRRGIFVLWLLQWTPKLNRAEYSPRRFERWLHAAYFGRLYFWLRDLTIISYRFQPHKVHVDSVRFVDKTGKDVVIKGHQRFSKRFKRLVAGDQLDLVRDFAPTSRPAWRGAKVEIPAASLFIDRYRKVRPTTDDYAL